MPGNKVSSHPLETLNGVRAVPGGGLVEESGGKGSWTGLS